MKRTLAALLMLCAVIGCKKENSSVESTGPEVTDAQLFHMALATPKAAFYKNSTDTIQGNSGTAHPGKILVWYNAIAKEQLDAQGKVKASASFSDSALIVKEIFNNNERTAIAVLYKLRSAANAGANGWVWSEMDGTGSPLISAKEKGNGCSGCHAIGSNVDYTRMNDAHP